MARSNKIKTRMHSYIVISVLLGILLGVIDFWLYVLDYKAGIMVSIFLVIYFVAILSFFAYSKKFIIKEMVDFATQYGQVQKQILNKLELPHALLDTTGRILWMNEEFQKITEKQASYHKNIATIFPEINEDVLDKERSNTEIEYETQDFRVVTQRIVVDDYVDNEFLEETDDYNVIIGVYLFNETALKVALRENDNQSLAVGLLYLDNCDEVLEGIPDVKQSLLLALIDRRINKCIANLDGIVRKLEKDKYIIILRKQSVNLLKEKKFEILEEVKTVNIGNERPITLSIGIGLDGLSYAQNAEFARAAIDLALGRGGDQAVVKVPNQVQYFGGKREQMEKSTRVKARVKAQALEEILTNKDQIFVMGHRLGDVDSFGSAVGIACIARHMQKEIHIVLNDITPSLAPVVDLYKSQPDYIEGTIMTSQQALEAVGSNAVLVVVDINKPSITECPDLLKKCKAIVVLDHHRQGTEVIDNATLSYIEPYASSACEMVSEILQYIANGIKISGIEADCMYSGIVIDTNNFTTKTGVRTFEAAAYLRRTGADVTRVRKLFREDASEYMAKARTIRDAYIYKNDYAISICDGTTCQSPTIVAAQAANELLNIIGVKASFVFVEYQSRIYLSARSIDELNVQVITEKLGGGGHMNVAGAQFTGITCEEAAEKLKEVLDKEIESGEV